jgi:hypothetical protein
MTIHFRPPVRATLAALLLSTALPFASAQGQAPQATPAPQPPQAAASAPAAAPPSQAERLLFEREHLANISQPRVLRYVYAEEAAGKPPVTDQAVLTLRTAADGSCCDVHGDYLSGAMTVSLPDIPHAKSNPLLLYFLESEVRQMQRVTGGQAAHFRRYIRQELVDSADVTDTTVTWGGKTVPARRVHVVPFRRDPLRNRFMPQARTEYAFVLSDAVPGGVYQVTAVLPAEAAGAAPLARRTLTIDDTP